MAVMQMQKVGICCLNKYRKNILEDLQKFGFMEIDHNLDKEGEFSRKDTSSDRTRIAKQASQAERALEIIDLYSAREAVAFASLRGKRTISQDIYEAGATAEENLLSVSEKLVSIDRDIVGLKADNARLANQIDELEPWEMLDISMDFQGTKSSELFVGTISEDISEREVESRLKEVVPEIDEYVITKVSGSQDMSYFVALVIKEKQKEFEVALGKIGFSRPSTVIDEIPAVAREEMKKQIAENDKKIDLLVGEVAGLAEKYEDLQMFADYCSIRANKYEVLGQLPQTKNAFALIGYVPKAYSKTLSEGLEKYGAIVEINDLEEDEEAPVLLKNNWLGNIGESTVESYDLPGKSEIDPSFIMMVFYVIFFGLMLSDAAYGAILSIATGIILLKFPNMAQGMKSLIKLFFLCGFSTLFWGIMFGGYFGDAFDIIATTYLGVDLPNGVVISPAWFAPLNNPMRLLIVCLLFGLIHMFTGMIIKGFQALKAKDYMAFFIDCVCSMLFVLGLILILLPTSLFESIAQMEFNFPPFVGMLSKVILIVGAAGLILFAGRESKNPVLRILLGVYEIYNDVTGWLSDTLSYSRLLALGLATGVIASVINQMGSMGGNSVVGTIIFIIVFIFGHVFNMAINLLGAYVHTCRLQYVEFFSKFYDGGGRKFTPYIADTKYVDIHKGGQKQ